MRILAFVGQSPQGDSNTLNFIMKYSGSKYRYYPGTFISLFRNPDLFVLPENLTMMLKLSFINLVSRYQFCY